MLAVMEPAGRQTDEERQRESRLRMLISDVAERRDKQAFGMLFDTLAPRLKSFMMRKTSSAELAEDLVQEAMLSVWTKAALYDSSKGSVTGWVYTIARNLRIDRLRRDGRMPLSELADYDEPADIADGEEWLGRKQEDSLVARALQSIPQDQRQVLLLSFVEDMPQSEIAAKLSIPLGTVKSRMRLAYGHLRRLLETSL